MNRTGLFIALAVGVIAGGLFAIFPHLDLTLARLSYDSSTGQFSLNSTGAAEYVRRGAMWIAWGLAVPAMFAPLWKLVRPNRPLLVRGRAILFLVTTIFLSAIVLPNVIFKSHWGRPRPITTVEFGVPKLFARGGIRAEAITTTARFFPEKQPLPSGLTRPRLWFRRRFGRLLSLQPRYLA